MTSIRDCAIFNEVLGVASYHPSVQVVQKSPAVITPTSTSLKEDTPFEESQNTESLDSLETVEVRTPILRVTYTPGEPTNNTSHATEVVQMLRSSNSMKMKSLVNYGVFLNKNWVMYQEYV